jgi:hypothetical protein
VTLVVLCLGIATVVVLPFRSWQWVRESLVMAVVVVLQTLSTC